MSMLTVPEGGLQLESSAKSSNFLPLQAFGLTLDDNAIEDMIKCVQNGDQIELSLGNNPVSGFSSISFLVELSRRLPWPVPAAWLSTTRRFCVSN